ncbi:MAG: hypothetical protein RR313_00130 [Anaerovoracaceae bacterium]
MSNIKSRIISAVLALVMILALLPLSLVGTEVQAATVSKGDVYWEKTPAEMSVKGLTLLEEINKNGDASGLYMDYWHHSSNDPKKGYWTFKANANLGIKGQTVSDKTFTADSITAGGVSDPSKVFVVKEQAFDIRIGANSETAKRLDAGEKLVINVKPARAGVTLESLFGDNMIIKTVEKQKDGSYLVNLTADLKINYYNDKYFNFNKVYGLNLRTFVPFIKNGYGYNLFSMFKDGNTESQGAGICWFDYGNPFSIKDMPEGFIHPTMIRPYDATDKLGGNAKKVNGGGKLYEQTPILDADGKYTNKTVDRTVNLYWNLYKPNSTIIEAPVKTYKPKDINIGQNTMNNGGAYGMVLEYPVMLEVYAKPQVKVVASYVELVGMRKTTNVTSDGKPIYLPEFTTLKESEVLPLEIQNDTVTVPVTQGFEHNGAHYKTIVNDIVSSPKDLDDPKGIKWDKDYTPESNKGKITATGEDIAYYAFGILTNDKPFIKEIESFNGFEKEKVMAFVSGVVTNSDHLASVITEGAYNIGNSLLNGVYGPKQLQNFKVPVTPLASPTAKTVTSKANTGMPQVGMTNTFSLTVPSLQSKSKIVYVRYICVPVTMQRNKIHKFVDGVEVGVQVVETPAVVTKRTDGIALDVTFKPVENAELIQWVTSEDKKIDLEHNPLPSGSQSGIAVPKVIENVLPTEDVFAEWKQEAWKTTIPTDVPEWRLSKYKGELGEWKQAGMWMNPTSDGGCDSAPVSSLTWAGNTNSGPYMYDTVNPNNMITAMGNQKVTEWLHSKALTKGAYTIKHSDPSVQVSVNGTMTLIKASKMAGLNVANWVKNNDKNLAGYDLTASNLPVKYSGGSQITMSAGLSYGIKNKDAYTHSYSRFNHNTWYCSKKNCSGHTYCDCYLNYETLRPKYTPATYTLNTTFDRYIPTNTDKGILKVPSVSVSTNGFTTLKYQPTATLSVYPEVGMLFAEDGGKEAIKWVVGDQARKISPVVYQTLDYKVSVNPKVTTTTMTTDSRVPAGLSKLGLTGKDSKLVIPKGAPVNTNFSVNNEKRENDKGIITVKTYALDIADNVKGAWGNGSYNSKANHDILKNKVANQAVTATSKLLIDSPAFGSLDYTGATLTSQAGKYTFVADNTLTHKIIVRGGLVIGVQREGKAVESMSSLKTSNLKLYTALIEMNLYNESNDRNSTVFKTFEYQQGKPLTEKSYIELLQGSRNTMDGIPTPNTAAAAEGKGWYSEDTTVLLIKEYSSNYYVSSPTFNDKIAMSVPGLTTPVNKNLFYSVMGKGYSYLKMNLPLTGMGNGAKDIDVYFEYSGYPQDDLGNGVQQVQFVVPNVSVLDSTRVR